MNPPLGAEGLFIALEPGGGGMPGGGGILEGGN